MRKFIVLPGIAILLFINVNSFAQCNLYELPLDNKISHSTHIFEGKVISKNCFWNGEHTLIYTSNTIEVYKVFKGTISSSRVEIISEGGTVGDKMHEVEPGLKLDVGDVGIFSGCTSSITDPQSQNKSNTIFQCYGSLQGFFRYDLVEGSATTPFKKYNDIQDDLYTAIQTIVGKTFKEISQFDANPKVSSGFRAGITSFSPSTISAGTNSVITIDGSGFGASRGSSTVGFKNADDGGASYINPLTTQYISWSDTQIKVKVPDNAGTGTIRVSASSTMTSSGTLTVSYAELNATSNNIAYQTDQINRNTTGGLTWQMYTTFNSNTAAKESMIRAINTWRCATHINWIIGATTTVNTIANDNYNVIRFDSGSELSSGVLGQCMTYWSGCSSSGTSVWYVEELDMVIDDATNWEFGPAAPTGSKYDFESVMLHELGHGHQLGHVIKSSDVMNYAVSNATAKRTLNVNNQAAGDDIMNRSVVANSCGPGAMTALSGPCAIGGPAAAFSGTPVSGCAPLSVTFTDASTNTPTSWKWDIDNNGTTDYTTQNPTHVYNTPGTYTVKLKVTNANGTDSIVKTNYITVNPKPSPGFTNTVNAGTVNFTNTSNNATSYSWNFGDASSASTAVNASHTYTSAGTYSVTLTATNSCGSVNTSQNITIGVNGAIYKPAPAFSASTTVGCPSLSVMFSDQSTENPSSWAWDIDNNGTIDYTIQNPTHVYTASGTYTVKLKVTNGIGSDSITKTSYITVNPLPTAAFSNTINLGTVDLTNTSTDAVSYSWDFGDASSASTAINTSHTYASIGTYTVTLTATNTCGSTSVSQPVTIISVSAPTPPVPDFSVTPGSGCAPLSVSFTDLSIANPTSWAWDIDNNGTIDYTSQNPTHVYTASGTYSVKLKVGNVNGYDSITKTSVVTVKPSPTAIVSSDLTYCTGTMIMLNPFSSVPSGASFSWTNSNTAIGLSASGNGNLPMFDLSNTSNADISGTITVTPTLNGCVGTPSSFSITVKPKPTVIVPVDLTICSGLSIATTSFSSDPSGATFSWTNSNTSIGLAASGTGDISGFTTTNTTGNSISGTITVTPVLDGCTGVSSSYMITVNPLDDAAFSYSQNTFCQSGTDPQPSINGLSGGTFSSGAGLSINSSTGLINMVGSILDTYTVVYSVNNLCANTSSKSVTITNNPDATFSYSAPSYCQNANVNPTPTFNLGASAGAFTSSPGLNFVNAGSGEINLSATTSGTYIITNSIAASGGCAAASADYTVTITGAPDASISYNGPYCQHASPNPTPTFNLVSGSPGTFSSSPAGLNFASAGTGEIDLSTTSPGVYTITNLIPAGNGCAAVSATNTVTVNPSPVAGFTSNVSASTATFTNTSGNADTYMWNFGDINSSNGTDASHTYAGPGTFTVTLTASNACGNDAASQTVSIATVIGTGINDEINKNGFSIYPNPSDGIITIEFPTDVAIGTLTVFNSQGAIVATVNQYSSTKKLNIDLSDLNAGVYCIVGNVNEKVIMKNVVLAK